MINATFTMMGKNPPSILLVAGVLFLLIGGITFQTMSINSNFFISTGGGLLALGIILQGLWLWTKKR